MIRSFFIMFLLINLIIIKLTAQPGSVDTSFSIGSGADNYVYSLEIQSDNKILVGGTFTDFNGFTAGGLVRLNVDGSVDSSFVINPSSSSNSFVCIKVQPDSKIITAGNFSYPLFNWSSCGSFVRLNSDGSLDSTFDQGVGASFTDIRSVGLQSDGKIVVVGGFTAFKNYPCNRIVRLNPNGTIDSTFSPGLGADQRIEDIIILENDKIIVSGTFTLFNNLNYNRIVKLNPNGSIDTTFNTGLGANYDIKSLCLLENNKLLIGGFFNEFDGNTSRYLTRVHEDGSYDTTFIVGNNLNNNVYSIDAFDQNNIIIGGNFSQYNNQVVNYFTSLSNEGSVNPFFQNGSGTNDVIRCSALQKDGKILLGGWFTNIDGINYNYIARVNGLDYDAIINVYNDINGNCEVNQYENGISNRVVQIEPIGYVGVTNAEGLVYIDSLPDGTYSVNINTSNYWSSLCSNQNTININQTQNSSAYINAPLISDMPCSSPEISVFAPTLRRGFSNQYIYIRACNDYDATATLDSAYCIISLDDEISVQSSNLQYQYLGSNKYLFDLGDIYPGECTDIYMNTTVSLNASANQTLCITAELYPQDTCIFDTIPTPFGPSPLGSVGPCTTTYDRSDLSVESSCVGDSVRFVIKNNYWQQSCYTPVRVYLDGQFILLDSIQLGGWDSTVYMFEGLAKTWVMEADQHPMYPGNSHPSAHIENCGIGIWTPGIITQFPTNDADPIVDIYCGQVTAPLDPNDKTGYPNGLTSNHYIQQNQDLEYLIRFQNVGTDTAVNIVIRDTLSTDLNIFTVTSGVSSFPYDFKMYGPRVLEWTFTNIMLPDSNVNEPASHGFVKFNVDQVPDLPYGTVIENSAAIYFDFEAPVITNTYFHTIHDFSMVIVLNENIDKPYFTVSIVPNPVNDHAWIVLDGLKDYEDISIEFFNIAGQKIQSIANQNTNKIAVETTQFSPGIYFIGIYKKGGLLSNAKMVVR